MFDSRLPFALCVPWRLTLRFSGGPRSGPSAATGFFAALFTPGSPRNSPHAPRHGRSWLFQAVPPKQIPEEQAKHRVHADHERHDVCIEGADQRRRRWKVAGAEYLRV